MLNTKQKVQLFFFGFVAAFLFLEIGLRLGGAVFQFAQERGNRVRGTGQEFRILCIGESTTALGGENSYPFQLEEILRAQRPHLNIKVINKGMVSKTSADILAALPGFLQQYRPHLVVGMIGINDRPQATQLGGMIWRGAVRHSRVFHLLDLLGEHVRKKVGGRSKILGQAPSSEKESSSGEESRVASAAASARKLIAVGERRIQTLLVQLKSSRDAKQQQQLFAQLGMLRVQQAWLYVTLGHYYLIRDDCPTAQTYYQKALHYEPNNYGALTEFGRCREKAGHCAEAIPLYERATQADDGTVLAKMGWGRCLDTLGQKESAYKIFRSLMQNEKDLFKFRRDIGDWYIEHRYFADADDVFRRAIADHPDDYLLYERLAVALDGEGRAAEAVQSRQQSQDLAAKADGYLPATQQDYQAIVAMVRRKGIPFIAMQYPLRRIEPLQAILSQWGEIIFVENRRNFQQALQGREYSDIFSDSFAGYFGHCTRAGNRLLAENLSQVILTQILSQIE